MRVFPGLRRSVRTFFAVDRSTFSTSGLMQNPPRESHDHDWSIEAWPGGNVLLHLIALLLYALLRVAVAYLAALYAGSIYRVSDCAVITFAVDAHEG
ncbi:hypothetical protein NMD86_11080 [Edwardsiella tarda]|uniref:hypothetical protein n=1 Tax=Edwardsiella tarda TaxID=636 RepID=UPI00351C5A34